MTTCVPVQKSGNRSTLPLHDHMKGDVSSRLISSRHIGHVSLPARRESLHIEQMARTIVRAINPSFDPIVADIPLR